MCKFVFFFSSRRRHTRYWRDWSSDVCSSDLKYFLSDGNVYESSDFSDYIHEELGRPFRIKIKAPVWVLRIVTKVGEYWGHVTGRMTALNDDKYNILRQRNWRCNIEPTMDELG